MEIRPALKAQSFKPPKDVADEAQRGLDLRDEFGRGGTDVGVARARDLSNRRSVSLETIQRMVAFFDRHEKNKDTDPEDGNGKIAWLLWGGDAGRRWAESILKRVEKSAGHPGAMICLIPPKRVREAFHVVGGTDVEDMHITLAYLGKADDLPDDAEDIISSAMAVLENFEPPRIGFSGTARFQTVDEDTDAIVALVDAPGIQEVRMAIREALDDAGIWVAENHSYTPHMTLAYVHERAPLPPNSRLEDLRFKGSKICLVMRDKTCGRYTIGERVQKSTVTSGDLADAGKLEPQQGSSEEEEFETGEYDFEAVFPIFKAEKAGEERFVLGVVLEPEVIDAHNDVIGAEGIRKTAHRFLAGYNRTTEMGLQHQRLGDIGIELVESYIAPMTFTVNGEIVRKGSWVMGAIIQDDEIWNGVKTGQFTGFSIAGLAMVSDV